MNSRNALDQPDQPLLLRAEDVSRRLSLGRAQVYKMMAQGELPTVRFGRSVRVPLNRLHEWIAAREEGVRFGGVA
jgi:excisionase family DNA binding protein